MEQIRELDLEELQVEEVDDSSDDDDLHATGYGGAGSIGKLTFNTCLASLHTYLGSLAPEIPEDLYHLIKKAVSIRKHLERNRKDKDSKFRLILVESRIQRLARYYKKTKKLPPVWKY
uniref:Ribosomal protein S13/S15 N-terminal domain-containing protein n=1 Tax=Fagus sylvatica TaxID=28930 RepID=A0A2N9F6L0_FAGSY